MKVKILTARYDLALQQDLNKFLDDNGITVREIKFSVAEHQVGACVIYEGTAWEDKHKENVGGML